MKNYDINEIIVFYAIIISVILLFHQIKKKKNREKKSETRNQEIEKEAKNGKIYQKYSYQPKWLLTINEKNAYKKIKIITDTLNYTLFAKVRLLDLVEPTVPEKGALYKIQAKHVDFVICDKNLVARWIIELQDNSHKNANRKERDLFVDEVLKSCGYKTLFTYNPTEEELNTLLCITPKE